MRKVERADTIVANYSYLADGTKAVAERGDGSGLVYRGSLTYRKDSTGVLTLESAPSPTGRITPDGMRYHITDHLGSVRAVIDGQSGAILEAGNYAVYGWRSTAYTNNWATASVPAGETLRDHFSGKEDQTPDFNLGITDFGARPYSPSLSRWLTPDPLSEKYYDVSPYVYCAGDPVNVLDREGDDIVIKGKNSSTLTFRTSINMDVNLSSIDFKGNYNLEGKDALGAALDIVGIFDQTGIADGANAALQLSQGDFGSAALSALAVAPVIGDLSKIGKATKDVRILSKAIVEAGGSPIFRSFTRSNFRENLIRRTGVNPKGMEAHHMIPHKFKESVGKYGIDVNDPKYGAWVEKDHHRHSAYQYNKEWADFLDKPESQNAESIEDFMRDIMMKYFNIKL